MSENKAFKKTGRNVTVSRKDLVAATIEKLMQYDSLSPSQRKNKSSPYIDPIYTQVAGGKMVQIPRYVQHSAVVKWNVIKQRTMKENSPAHTRLNNRERYAGSDPFIMNADIADTSGHVRGADDEYPEQDSYLEPDHELAKLRAYERSRRGDVGRAEVPDERYGRGGSYGDLPRDFEIYNQGISSRIADTQDFGAHPRMGQVMPDNSDDLEYPYNQNELAYIKRVNARKRRAVGSRTVRGPSLDDTIVGTDSDIRAESGGIEDNNAFTQYAPVDNDDNDADDADVDDMIGDRGSRGGRGGRGGEAPMIRPYMPPYVGKYNDVGCTSCGDDDNDDNVHTEPNGNDMYSMQDMDGDDPVIYGSDSEKREYLDNDDECIDTTYKYLFFILLFIVAYMIYYNRPKMIG